MSAPLCAYCLLRIQRDIEKSGHGVSACRVIIPVTRAVDEVAWADVYLYIQLYRYVLFIHWNFLDIQVPRWTSNGMDVQHIERAAATDISPNSRGSQSAGGQQ
jgi:hypothetical protein